MKWLILSLLMIGCGVNRIPADSRVSLSDQFSPDQTGLILNAMEEWRAATNDKVGLKVHIGGDDASPLIIKPGYAFGNLAYTDVVSNDTALMIIDVSMHGVGGWNLQTTTEHELGHAFGLDHLDGTLMMNGTPKTLMLVDSVTVNRFNSLY